MRHTAPPKFKILVANLAGSSDPSRNSGGNPVKLRTGFVLQQMVLEDGTKRIEGPTQSPPTISAAATDHTVSIQVANPTYWDPTATPPGPFYYQEEVRVYDQYPLAGTDFGIGFGSNTGPAVAVAISLANWLDIVLTNAQVLVGADTVYLSPMDVEPLFPVQATSDQYILQGLPGPVFNIRDNLGNLLNSPTNLRATFYLPKLVKSQSAPAILP